MRLPNYGAYKNVWEKWGGGGELSKGHNLETKKGGILIVFTSNKLWGVQKFLEKKEKVMKEA